MPLYRWNDDNLETVPPTTFEAEQLQERADLQRLLRDQPDVLEEGLFIVAEEYGNWKDSYRSIDLLALDRRGRLVVIELKRTQTGDHSELQAIRYAAMISTMTLDQVIDAHRGYLARRGIDEDARVQILNHLEVAEDTDAEIHTERPRIILASAGFSTELTTSVLWLRDGGMDISCIKLQLYRNGDGLLMDTSQVIPLPESSDYLVKVREKQEEAKHKDQVITSQGGEAFLHSIETANDDQKERLQKIYQWAVSLEQAGLASLRTRNGSYNTVLRVGLPNVDRGLVYVYKNRVGSGYLEFNGKFFSEHAPKSKERTEEVLGFVIKESSTLWWKLPDGLLDALTDAYREANRLPTTPHPDTVPDTPAPVE